MAADHYQSVIESSTATNHTVTLTGVPAGSTILVAIRMGGTSGVTWTVSDDIDGAYTEVFNTASTARRLYVFKLENATAGDRIITATIGSSNTIRWGAIAFSGTAAAGVEDFDTAAFTTTTTPATGNVTTTVANSRICGILVCDASSTTIAPNGGETERQEQEVILQFQDEDAPTAGDYNSTWLLGATQPGIYAAIALKAAAVAAVVWPQYQHRRSTLITM